MADSSPPARRRTPGLVIAGIVVAALGLGVAAGLVALGIRQHQNASLIRPTGVPGSMSTQVVDLMQLSPVPHSKAPDFDLTDQAGHLISLASLRGKVVVLEFMDSHCTDICPIVSQEFITAYHDLGRLAPKVEFLAVNVNKYHLQVADVAAFSTEQHLTTIPAWHFLTGPFASLRTVWRAYGEAVYAPGPNADIVHSSFMYFIDPQGRERFLANPMVDHSKSGSSYLPANQLAAWGQGIAQVARQLTR
jgi:cytochrome oxidase Cu insertion factor (SCO1/SenC/PrrC family)